jgi:polyisoprenyl-phosphate glycosyltransferase
MNVKNSPLISVIVPAYNESKNILPVSEALSDLFIKTLPDYAYEIIFVDDGSSDDTVSVVKTIQQSQKNIVLVSFTRNFGKEMATTAGLHEARGCAVLMIDADLQHPVSLIPTLISEWEKGSEVVVGVRAKNKNEGLIKKYGSKLFYKLLNTISDIKQIPGETDFRLLDRVVVDEFKKLGEVNRMTRSLINWLGFRATYVPFEASERLHGEASYSVRKLIKLAFDAFLSNSTLPLRLVLNLGAVTTILSFVGGSIVFIERYLLGDYFGWGPSGSAQLAILTVFFIGIVLTALGLIARYLETVHQEGLKRPLYVIRK